MWLIQLGLGLAAIYVAIISGVYLGQSWLLFPTGLAAASHVQLPATARHLKISTADGERLIGVRIPAQSSGPDNRPTLLGFGGNAWNAEVMALYLHGLFPDCDVVAVHYRGYHPSSGSPSAQALFEDSLAIYDALQEGAAPERVVAVGFSIGSAVAAYLTRHRPITGLIMVTPFDSLEALARDLYWWAPVRLLLRHRMPTIDFVRGSTAPTALIIAQHDSIVPARRTAPLRAAISNLVLDRTITAGHNDLYDRPAFAEAMREGLAKILEAPSTPPAAGPDCPC